MNYLDKLNIRTKEYFEILEPNFPEWLMEYINTDEMLKQQYISITCGTNPLVNEERISNICKIAKNMINKNLAYDMSKYVYIMV